MKYLFIFLMMSCLSTLNASKKESTDIAAPCGSTKSLTPLDASELFKRMTYSRYKRSFKSLPDDILQQENTTEIVDSNDKVIAGLTTKATFYFKNRKFDDKTILSSEAEEFFGDVTNDRQRYILYKEHFKNVHGSTVSCISTCGQQVVKKMESLGVGLSVDLAEAYVTSKHSSPSLFCINYPRSNS